MTELDRFLSKIEGHASEDACLIWKAYRFVEGYGGFWSGDRNVRAHRWSYEYFVGPIPEGLSIDHLCNTPSCVNPFHLEAVPIRENVLRGDGPPARNARKTHCPRGHELTAENTLNEGDGWRRCRICRLEQKRSRANKARRAKSAA